MRHERNAHHRGARFKILKTKTNMAAHGFLRARSLLYRWPRNSLIKEASLHIKTFINSVYLRKSVSGIQCFQCFPNFKERTKDSQSGCNPTVTNLARAQQCPTEVKENHPKEKTDSEPPRKIETRSQVRFSS